MTRPAPRRPWHLGAGVTLAVRKDGRWRVRWPAEDGRPKEQTFAHHEWEHAQLFAQDLARAFQHHGTSAASRLERRATPWAQVLERWLTVKEPDWTPSIWQQHAGLLRKWALPRIATIPMAELLLEHYQLVLADLSAAGKNGSRARVRSLLSQLERWAAANGYLEARPFPIRARTGPVRGAVTADGPDFVDLAARPDTARVEHLIEVLRSQHRARPDIELQARLAAYSGLRLGETLALRTCHLDEQRQVVAVRWQYVSEPGTAAVLKRPKTGKVRVALLLDNWSGLIAATRSRSRSPNDPPCPDCETTADCRLLFPAPRGGPDIAASFRNRVVNPAFKAARDAPVDLRWPQTPDGGWRWPWRTLRHHAAIFHLDGLKLGVADTAALLGHTPKVLMDRYYGTSCGVVERAVAAAATWAAEADSPTSR